MNSVGVCGAKRIQFMRIVFLCELSALPYLCPPSTSTILPQLLPTSTTRHRKFSLDFCKFCQFCFVFYRFQKACIKYGVPDTDLFQTTDLWDQKNIALVTQTIFAIGRTVSTKLNEESLVKRQVTLLPTRSKI